jgi:hypothetical protein
MVNLMQGSGLWGGLARVGVGFIEASPRLQALTKVMMVDLLGQLQGDVSQAAGLPPGVQRLFKVLVRERNGVVLRDLRAALARRPPPPSVAVLYGAGHMADLELRLQRELGYRPLEERWLTAFGVDVRAAGLSSFELDITRQAVRQQLRVMQLDGEPAAQPAATPVER